MSVARGRGRSASRPALHRILDSMRATPAFVLDTRLCIVDHNTLGRALLADAFADPKSPPNLARFVFLSPQASQMFSDWAVADDVVSALQQSAARAPYDRALCDLVGELSTHSREFCLRWAKRRICPAPVGARQIHHPVVGDIVLDVQTARLQPGGQETLVMCSAEPGSSSFDALELLASWTQRPADTSDADGAGRDVQGRR